MQSQIQKMNSKEEQESSTSEEETLRHRLLPLFILNSPAHILSFSLLELILDLFNYLQLLKFPVDYSSDIWTGEYIRIFTYIDPAYYIGLMNDESKGNLVIAGIVLMNVYTLALLLLYFLKVEYETWMAGIRKMLFFVYRHFLLIPLFRIILSFFSNSESDSIFMLYIPNVSFIKKVLFIISFIIFLGMVAGQSYFNFEFLPNQKKYVRLRKSSHTPLVFFLYFMLSEITVVILQDLAQIAALNLLTILVIVFVIWKDEQVQEKAKLIEFSCLGSIMSGYLIVDAMKVSGCHVELYVYFIICASVTLGTLQLKTYSIRFQLENINKWPTQEIMIKQESTIRYYLSRGSEYLFKIWIYGYMEIHRQKCDSMTCPSRCVLSERDKKVLAECDHPNIQEQLVRLNNIMKVIFTAGYKLNPIPGEIQLEYCRYAYERSEYELALRRLLVINYQDLTLDRYYQYKYLKQMLSTIIKNDLHEQFLDFVTEMALKREEEQITKKFEKAAFLNLQFWSILNDDHPDFEKLNEVSLARIQIAKAINKQFRSITSYAHSQKITTIYSYYLECLENDELMHYDIYENLKRDFQLDRRTLVRDWSNSSTNVALVSLQESNFGKIIEINASCAALFGYQKHELTNQPVSNLLPEDLKVHFPTIVHPRTNDDTFLLVHKNSYLIAVKKTAKHYNSMSTGATALITFELQLTPFCCQLMIDKNNKIIAQSASLISVLGLDLKAFEGQSYTYQFFTKNLIQLDQNSTYKAKDILKPDFLVDKYYKQREFQIRIYDQYQCKVVGIKDCEGKEDKKVLKKVNKEDRSGNFQFQVEATSSQFKYMGKSNNEESFISQFSQSQYLRKKTVEEDKINYAANISILRLRDNAIQYIEENQESASQMFIKHEESSAANLIAIARKDEEQIFQSKQSYQKFLSKCKVGSSIYIILTLTLIIVFGLYIVIHILQKGDINTAETYSSEVINENTIISHIERQARTIHDMYLLTLNKSLETPSFFVESFEHTFQHVKEIQLQGSEPYPLTVTVDGSTSTLLRSQYLSTLINYGNSLLNVLEPVTTVDELRNVLDAVDPYTMNYLLTPNITAPFMKQKYSQRQQQMIADLNQKITIQKILISVGFVTVTAIGILLCYSLHSLNKEKVKIFEIFLEISQIQIQHFSSKTQRFLVSLHSQETNNDIEQQIQHKKYSSSFSKKKSFKFIKANIFLYIKVSIVLVIMTFFFLHSYLVSVSESQFQVHSLSFMGRTAQMGSVISNTKDKLLMHSLYGIQMDFQSIAQNMLQNNRQYLHSEQKSFGLIEQFQQFFQFILRGDLCSGFQSAYGFVNIPQSCDLTFLNQNGSFLLFMHVFHHVQYWEEAQFQEEGDHNNHVLFQILMEIQDIVLEKIVQFQNSLVAETKTQLLFALLLWIGITAFAALVIWGRQIGNFLNEINEIRVILGILPLKMVKENPLALKFVKENLDQNI